MFGALAGLGPLVAAGSGHYEARTEQCVERVANGCGMDGASERARFVACRQRLSHWEVSESADPFKAAAAGFAGGAPLVFELILAYAAGQPRGFGYLTQGRITSSLPDKLQQVMHASFELYLQNGGTTAGAELMADVFRLAFPQPATLATFEPTSPAMGVAFGPVGQRLDLKVYLNTRLHRGDHRARVRAILQRVGIDSDGFDGIYDALYDERFEARFSGVGVDVSGDGDSDGRAKLYVRTDTERAFAHLAAVGQHLQIDIDEKALEHLLPNEELARELELAVGLRSDGSPTLKLTYFFGATGVSDTVIPCVSAMLKNDGYDPAVFERAIADLRGDTPIDGGFPLHGVGLEFPRGENRKVNLYMKAVG